MSLNVPQLNLDVFISLIGLLSYNGSAPDDANNEDENQNWSESFSILSLKAALYDSPLISPSLASHIGPTIPVELISTRYLKKYLSISF